MPATITLFDFYAEWCGPCQTMETVLDTLVQELNGAITLIRIDIDQQPSLAKKFHIQSVPTFILFKADKEVWKQSGTLTVHQFKSIINRYND